MFVSESLPLDQLDRLASEFHSKLFNPPRILTHGDMQTLSAYFWPGRFPARDLSNDEERLFEVEPGSRVLAHCRWQPERDAHPAIVLWHGIEGSTRSAYMVSTAEKAFRAGFNVVRVNYRNCGGTEHLTPTLYHGGMSGDVRAVIEQLIESDKLTQIFAVGFSLGGNKVLKFAGEIADQPLPQLAGVAAISPSVDLRASSDLLMTRRNWIYHKDFLYYLKRRIKLKANLFPHLYDVSGLRGVRSIRDYDNTYVAPAFGFADAADYYAKASSLPCLDQIPVPTLIIHAQDDPFVPFAPLRTLLNGSLREVSFTSNPNILLLAPERGGHVAFLSSESPPEDRFWAENRLIDFCLAVRG